MDLINLTSLSIEHNLLELEVMYSVPQETLEILQYILSKAENN